MKTYTARTIIDVSDAAGNSITVQEDKANKQNVIIAKAGGGEISMPREQAVLVAEEIIRLFSFV